MYLSRPPHYQETQLETTVGYLRNPTPQCLYVAFVWGDQSVSGKETTCIPFVGRELRQICEYPVKRGGGEGVILCNFLLRMMGITALHEVMVRYMISPPHFR